MPSYLIPVYVYYWDEKMISIVTESVELQMSIRKYWKGNFCTQKKGTDVENGSRIIIKTREKVKIANQLDMRMC